MISSLFQHPGNAPVTSSFWIIWPVFLSQMNNSPLGGWLILLPIWLIFNFLSHYYSVQRPDAEQSCWQGEYLNQSSLCWLICNHVFATACKENQSCSRMEYVNNKMSLPLFHYRQVVSNSLGRNLLSFRTKAATFSCRKLVSSSHNLQQEIKEYIRRCVSTHTSWGLKGESIV